MNYRAWVENALDFTRSLGSLGGDIEITAEAAPPLDLAGLAAISSAWPTRLPRELIRFWTEGSAHLNCTYYWEPPQARMEEYRAVFPYGDYALGGAAFAPAAFAKPIDTADWGDDGAAVDPVDARLRQIVSGAFGPAGDLTPTDPDATRDWLATWRRCIIFLLVGNGDCLGLDPGAPGTDPNDPAVVYLCHESPRITRVAGRFTTFMQVWEKLCYIDVGKLNMFRHPQTREFEPEGGRAVALRKLLSGVGE